MNFLLPIFFLLFLPGAHAAEDELLPPEQAFRLEATLGENNRINLNWEIAEGYYLYQEKLSLVVNQHKLAHTELTLPQGIEIEDPLFGLVTTYENELTFSHPADADEVALVVNYQGCNKPLGVCYPPQTDTFSFISQAQAQTPVTTAQTGIFDQGSIFSTVPEDDFLPVDEAFTLVVTATGEQRIVANFEAADGYYLYQPHIMFSSASDDIVIRGVEYPKGKLKQDPHFGEIEVYYGLATIPLELARKNANQEFTLTVQYQGCAEDGICYPPQTRDIPLVLAAFDGPFAADNAPGSAQELDKSVFWYLLAAFGGGLLLTFTPCVLPMIPILSGIIMSEKGKGGVTHAGMLSLIYVAGTALSYTLIGAVAGASGEQLQAYFQTPWAIGGLSAILVVMALSMFGLFKLQVPAFMQTLLAGQSQKLAGGGALSIFFMGVISALIIGACVSPLLISTLGIAIAAGSPVLGGALMFSMALGMGVVLVLFGFGFTRLAPKAGAWMEQVNTLIGILLLAVALYLLSFIPEVPILLLWSLLLVGAGVYLFTLKLPDTSRGLNVTAKSVAAVSLVWGVLALVGGLNGYRDITNPLPVKQMMAGSGEQTGEPADSLAFEVVTSNEQVDRLFEQASAKNKLLMLDYYADWCLDCLRMDATTFMAPAVVDALGRDFIVAKVDVSDANDDAVKAVKKRFNVYGPPATLFFTPDGQELDKLKFYGYRDDEEFMEIVKLARNQG